jgi:hypothetical protein
MLNPGFELTRLAAQHTQHCVERDRFAAAGQGSLPDLAGFGQHSPAGGSEGLTDCAGCLVVKCGCGGHAAFLAKSRQRTSRWLGRNKKRAADPKIHRPDFRFGSTS